jgi:hypothetical protein
MSNRKLIGHCGVDSGQICIADPCVITNSLDDDFQGLTTATGFGDGFFPVYFVEDEEGGYGKSRIIIELGPMDREGE